MNRKAFFHLSMRIGLLGILGMMGAFLALNRNISSRNGCQIHPLCEQCPSMKGCKKPQATKAQTHE